MTVPVVSSMCHSATTPAGGGLGADCTTAVAFDVPDALPAPFVPVTTTRRVAPASAVTTVYVAACAAVPAMFAHAAPDASQRCHWYVKAIGCVPVHVPGAAVRAWSTCGVPVIVGATVFVGAVEGPTTVAVGADVASAEPTVFAPVTITRRVAPTSPATTVYVCAVPTSVHVPAGEQRCQR